MRLHTTRIDAEQHAAQTAMAAGKDVHRYKGETMSHQGGNTLRTALIAVAAAAVFILGCGLFTLHVLARSAAHIACAQYLWA